MILLQQPLTTNELSPGLWLTLFFSLVSSAISIIGWTYFVTTWKVRMDTRVNFMWDKIFEPAMISALRGGLLKKESPLRLNVEALSSKPGLVDRIQVFYNKLGGKKLADWELMAQLEEAFGEEFKELERETNGKLAWEGTVMAAAFLVRPEMNIFRQWDTKLWEHPIQSETKES